MLNPTKEKEEGSGKPTFTFETQGNNTNETLDNSKVKADAANKTEEMKSSHESRPKYEKSERNDTEKLTEKSTADDHAKSDTQTKLANGTGRSIVYRQDPKTA